MKDPIVQAGDPILRQRAKPVPKQDIGSPTLTKLIKRMSAILKKEPYGVALAAPQVGAPLRLFVVAGKVFKKEEDSKDPPDVVFINPEILKKSRTKQEMQEGCLSVRGKYGTVLRHEKTSIKALTQKGASITYHGSGLVGHIFQHECDHLDGVLYIDKATSVRNDQPDDE